MLTDVGIESVKLPPRSPNLNSYAERFVRTIKESCLEQMILFGEDALRTGIRQFLDHYHLERNHQSLENRLITPMKEKVNIKGRIERRERLGGLLNYYHRAASVFFRLGASTCRSPLATPGNFTSTVNR